MSNYISLFHVDVITYPALSGLINLKGLIPEKIWSILCLWVSSVVQDLISRACLVCSFDFQMRVALNSIVNHHHSHHSILYLIPYLLCHHYQHKPIWDNVACSAHLAVNLIWNFQILFYLISMIIPILDFSFGDSRMYIALVCYFS